MAILDSSGNVVVCAECGNDDIAHIGRKGNMLCAECFDTTRDEWWDAENKIEESKEKEK